MSAITPYELVTGQEITSFEFISEGPKGKIEKIIQFKIIAQDNDYVIYNLAFGDKNIETGEIDDLAVTNNGDTEKTLATVVVSVNFFLGQHSSIGIYATGSTKARTRLYRMGISKYFNSLESELLILGQTKNDNWLPFQKGIDYKAFLVYKKEVNLDYERNS